MSRKTEKLEKLCDEIKNDGGKATVVAADVIKTDDWKEVVDTAKRNMEL
ncbi:hypothetical protein [Nonlabens spongiae]|nr:hypothetical protein [Nonlabens spongiae]